MGASGCMNSSAVPDQKQRLLPQGQGIGGLPVSYASLLLAAQQGDYEMSQHLCPKKHACRSALMEKDWRGTRSKCIEEAGMQG